MPPLPCSGNAFDAWCVEPSTPTETRRRREITPGLLRASASPRSVLTSGALPPHMPRQPDGENRLSGAVLGRYLASVAARDLVHDEKAKPGTARGIWRPDEWCEEIAAHVIWQHSGVRNV